MTDTIAILDHWQTLIGSILGGVFALLTALIVASSAVRSARRTAATLLVADLLAIIRTADLEDRAEKQGVEVEKRPLWVAEKLIWKRPRLPESYDAYAANLVGVHKGLSAHLSLLKMVYSSLDDHLARIEKDFEDLRTVESQRIPRDRQATLADAKVVADGLRIAAAHAGCATHLLEQLVLASTPVVFTRIRMRLCPTPIEIQSRSLLCTGSLRPS